jgi:hypothetical protein
MIIAEEKAMPQETAVRRLSLNVPVTLVETLQEISATSNVTLTELLCAGLQMVQAGYQAEATGGRVIITNRDGQAERVLVLPRHGMQEIALTTEPLSGSVP